MNGKRKIKQLFSEMDNIDLPKAEKMLPPEALVARNSNTRRVRKPLPKHAAVGFAAVALVLAGALVAGSVAVGSGNKQAPDGDIVLKNDSEISTPSNDDITPDESKVALEDMPIISCGKYSVSPSDDFYVTYERDKVYFELMKGLWPADMDEYLTRDDALYAVYFKEIVIDCREFAKAKQLEQIEQIEQIEQELQQNKKVYVEELLGGILSKYGKEGFNAIVNGFLSYCCEKEEIDIESVVGSLVSALKDYKSYGEFVAEIVGYDDYDEFCNTFALYYYFFDSGVIECINSNDARREYFEWRKTLWYEFKTFKYEYEDKLLAIESSLYKTAKASMYEYLESLNIQFYEKQVYCESSFDGETYEISPFHLEFSDGVYSIAFLTREQIKSLEAEEGCALIITLACEELATMDNEPVVIDSSFYCLDD